MNKLPHDDHRDLVSFLKQNCPVAPSAECNLEQRLMDSIAHQPQQRRQRSWRIIWTIPSAIATGVLFTALGMGFRSPQIAIESEELENFIVNSWNETIDRNSYTFSNEAENYWSLLENTETQATLSLSAP